MRSFGDNSPLESGVSNVTGNGRVIVAVDGWEKPLPHRPYVFCWCTLDDVTEENGTVYLLPYDRARTRDRVEHVRDARMCVMRPPTTSSAVAAAIQAPQGSHQQAASQSSPAPCFIAAA